MKTTEFYKERFELLEEDLRRYLPQRDNNTGKQYIYDGFPTIEEFKDSIEIDLLENPYDDEIEQDITQEEEEKLFKELFEDFTELYNRVKESRKPFEDGE